LVEVRPKRWCTCDHDNRRLSEIGEFGLDPAHGHPIVPIVDPEAYEHGQNMPASRTSCAFGENWQIAVARPYVSEPGGAGNGRAVVDTVVAGVREVIDCES
jgi:hypothetical protein